MTRLSSSIDRQSEAFQTQAAQNRDLVDRLRTRTAQAALGGPEASRQRHESRGTLLPRDRVLRLLDPGAPFLEVGALAAFGLYDDEAPGAGVIAGVGRVSGRELMIVADDIGFDKQLLRSPVMRDVAMNGRPAKCGLAVVLA